MTRIARGQFWAVQREPVRMPWQMRAALILGALVWCFAIIGVRSLFGQVTAVAEMRDGAAELFVGNPTTKPLRVSVSLFRDATPKDGAVALGDSVSALITPREFTLGPGEMQTIRLRIREAVKLGELLRLVTMLDPTAQPDSTQGIRLVFRTRIITKVQVVP